MAYTYSESENNFTQSAVFGSLAYDYRNPFLEPGDQPQYEEREEVAVAPPIEETVVAEQTKTHAVAQPKQAIAPFAVIGYACAAVLLVISLFARIQVMTVSDGIVDLQEQLEELETEKSKLLIDYESAFNLNDVETYATTVLGMQTPKDDQVCYVDGSSPDKAEIVESDTESEGFKLRLSDFFGSLGDYFG